MSYTTRCPACGTTFRVVPDQLKISDGWVRCGHCADVFDATLYLQPWVPPPAPATPNPVWAEAPAPYPEQHRETPFESATPLGQYDVAPQSDAVVGAEALSPQRAVPTWPAPDVVVDSDGLSVLGDTSPVDVGRETDWTPEPEIRALAADAPTTEVDRGWRDGAEAMPAAEPRGDAGPSDAFETSAVMNDPSDASSAEEQTSDFHAELARFAEAAGRAVPETVETPVAPAQAPEPSVVQVPDEVAAVQETPAEPGFVRQARRQAFWRSPAVRAALALLAVLLGGLLGAQWAVQERDTLAARHPEWAPLLAQLCAPLGCEMGPVRRIDAVVIDSSTLARRLGNFYAFDLVLKNTAPIPVAVPALELSLTDTRDSVIARRVFLQSELPGAPTLLPAQGSLPLSLRLSISGTGAVSMAGYRALVFYP
ncbi:DUF3426 domain-containing protein [Hydrogenophaga sp.]|uniref:DUF3426 domain-containing protein n=1 Tax=Hydrogenophaga sp. TaxID=1904254 RepID=UPI00286DD9A4|nr:DUF3426 domain-containing protein [Hydrogenophaga sp.]